MKISPSAKIQLKGQKAAFTLIEMIGVLAVIAILAALLIPKVFSAIDSARVNGACITCDTIKTAIADHYGKYGRFDAVFGTNTTALGLSPGATASGYDTKVLLPEGLIDKPFTAKIAGGDPSTNALLQIDQAPSTVGHFAGINGTGGYALDGTNDVSTNCTYVLEAVLYGVTQQDAKDLNDRIDGPPLGASLGQADTKGRVEYDAGAITTVYVYLTSR